MEKNVLLGEPEFELIKGSGLQEIMVRSPLHCQLDQGICSLCYGSDMGRGG